MSTGEIKTAEEARRRLGVSREAGQAAIRAAFQRAAKATHPDRGGDAAQFRRVLDAYRLLKEEVETPPSRPKGAAPAREPEVRAQRGGTVLKISIAEAFLGGARTIRLDDGRRGRIKLPPGLRSGSAVRVGMGGDQTLSILITPEPSAEIRGHDLWLTVGVSKAFLTTGGRIETRTPFGARRLWVSRTSAARGLFRAPGEGLPAVGSKPRGHLYLTFVVDEEAEATPAKSLLRRFAQAWAA